MLIWCRHIHRADFHRALLERATELGVKVHLNSRVASVDMDKAEIVTDAGVHYNGDLIIGADGKRFNCSCFFISDIARSSFALQVATSRPSGSCCSNRPNGISSDGACITTSRDSGVTRVDYHTRKLPLDW